MPRIFKLQPTRSSPPAAASIVLENSASATATALQALAMLSEDFVSAICGPPSSSNTAVAKHAGLCTHTLSPTYATKYSFKNSASPANCVAVGETHIFAAQHAKACVHVYARQRGNLEAFVSWSEKITCLTLAGPVLVLGTAEGRLMLWETCTGRLVETPQRHVQAVSCVAAAPHHILTGSDDSDVHVWSLAQLLELGLSDAALDHKPQRSLSNHRAGITALAVTQSAHPETGMCISASRDKSCIVWNYQAGEVLRTLLFPSFPLCLSLDPASRALFVASQDGSLYLVEFFGQNPLLGPYAEHTPTAVQPCSAFGAVPADIGPASCVGSSHDGTTLLTGHPNGQILRWDVAGNKTPVELANLGAAVTNLIFIPPLSGTKATTKAFTIIKPLQGPKKTYTLTAQLQGSLQTETRFDTLLNSVGFPHHVLQEAALAVTSPYQPNEQAGADALLLQQQNEELWDIIRKQQMLQKQTMQRYVKSRSAS